MATPTSMPAYQTNQLVRASDAQLMMDGSRNIPGSGVAAILGITSANSMDSPLTVTISGMTVTIGGSGGQKILLNSASGPRIVDSIPVTTETVPTANGTYARHDLICATYSQAQTSPGTSSFNVAGTITTNTIYVASESCTFTYVTGTASASPADPSVPAGAVAIARVTVPAGSTTPTVANLLTTMQAQILGGVSGFVQLAGAAQTITSSLNLSNVLNYVSGLQIANSNSTLSQAGIRLDANNNLSIAPWSPGHVLSLGFDDFSLAAIKLGPNNSWGRISGLGYSPDTPSGASGSPGYTVYGTNCTLTAGFLHVGSSVWNGQPGDIMAERGNATGVIFLGNTGSYYLYTDATNYYLPKLPLVTPQINLQATNDSNVTLFTPNTNGSASPQNVGGQGFLVQRNGNNLMSLDANGNMGLNGYLSLGSYNGVSLIAPNDVKIGSGSGPSSSAIYLSSSGVATASGLQLTGNGNAGNLQMQLSANNGANQIALGSNTNNNLSGVIASAYSIALLSSSGSFLNYLMTLDVNGDMAISGTLHAYSMAIAGNIIQTSGGFTSTSGSVTAASGVFNQVTVTNGSSGYPAFVPPVYAANGNSVSNPKIVFGQTYVSGGSQSVTLQDGGTFTGASTYVVTASSNSSGGYYAVQTYLNSGTQFTLQCNENVTVCWMAVGY